MGTLKKNSNNSNQQYLGRPSNASAKKDRVEFKKVSSEELLKRRVSIYPYLL